MALITNPAKRKGMTILASDLTGATTFDVKQTIPSMDMSSNQYDVGMDAYLKYLHVSDIDKQYNAAVKQFEQTLQEQEVAAKLQANFVAATGADAAVEAQPGLGTGAAGIASAGRAAQLGAMHGEIESQIAETYQTGIENMTQSYRDHLESLFGKYDETTGTFAGLTEYENLGNAAGDALAEAIAYMIKPARDPEDTTDSILAAAGLANSVNGDLEFTEAGEAVLRNLVNGIGLNEQQMALAGSEGARTLVDFMAESMAKQSNPLWDSLSGDKQSSETAKYRDWLNKNFDFLRVSHWDMYEETDGQIVPDIMSDMPSVNAPGVFGDGRPVLEFWINSEEVGKYAPSIEDLAEVKRQILNGEIRDGSYFAVQQGGMETQYKYYYLKDGYIFETEYTGKNPPKEIDAATANVRSFGAYRDVGTGRGQQDKYVQNILDMANSGKIAEGTVFQMNYGIVANRNIGWYMYKDGKFTAISESEAMRHPRLGHPNLNYDDMEIIYPKE